MSDGRVTERSFYPVLKERINAAGGKGVSEVQYRSVPDLVFTLGGYDWILSVKIGDTLPIQKEALLQYIQHAEDSKIKKGMLLFLPESIRNIEVAEDALDTAVNNAPTTVLILAGDVKTELRNRPFPAVLEFLKSTVIVRLRKKETAYFELSTVVSLLQQQVSEMMNDIDLDEDQILRIVTNKRLLMNLGHLKPREAEAVGRFLSSYILMSQILFLRLFYTSHENLFDFKTIPATKHGLRKAFKVIEAINYRPIYSVDVLDSTPDKFIKETSHLIWGLEIERAKHELPGRVFHELMPSEIRKMLAAFYTRPLAADLLAALSIGSSTASVFDPACGSGTILVSAYNRKLHLHSTEGRVGNPHKRFCEEDIFGADIMPFSVHLTEANLAALDIATTIERTQIIQGDSLKSVAGVAYPEGVLQTDMFPAFGTDGALGTTSSGEEYTVELRPTDVVLMNPPFTKVERGIAGLVDMERFRNRCGGEVGLWGHFIVLADEFLKQGGTYGAVIPINVLRGRESAHVRSILFREWTPLYVVKAVRNYAFSEWAEYRDILVVAKKEKPSRNHVVKFCLIKKDLSRLDKYDIESISAFAASKRKLRTDLVDMDSHRLQEIQSRFDNLMWYCGVTDFKHRDTLTAFVAKAAGKLRPFPSDYFKEGYRPVPKGVSSFLFATRASDPVRVREAFLKFSTESDNLVRTSSPMGAPYEIEAGALTPTLRTPIGLSKMDMSGNHDLIAHRKYRALRQVVDACGFKPPEGFNWDAFWTSCNSELKAKSTKLVVLRRINPYAPSTYHFAYFSKKLISPSNQVSLIMEVDEELAKAVCALLNSVLFISQFFMLKEESTGRYIDIRFYDLHQVPLFPTETQVGKFGKIFDTYASIEFPCLREQLDENFGVRYDEFWNREQTGMVQENLWDALSQPVKPFEGRLAMDLAVCDILRMQVTEKDILRVYDILVKEMIITRHLTRD